MAFAPLLEATLELLSFFSLSLFFLSPESPEMTQL
jgi:hypothetical protein